MLRRAVGWSGIALSVGLGLTSGLWSEASRWSRSQERSDAQVIQEPVEPAQAPASPSTEPAAEEKKLPASAGRELPPVRRARRPQFQPRDWDGVYFENLFREGLVGPRPVPGTTSQRSTNPRTTTPQTTVPPRSAVAGQDPAVGREPVAGEAENPSASGAAWSSVVTGEAIESEVKRLHLQLEQDLTTPIKFKTDYLKVRQTYSLLSMWFAIIFEYEGDVRWKSAAATVQPACWRAAANARTDGEQAYQYARLRKDELQELIRGGSFGDTEKPIEAVDWSQVVDRVPTMVQLEASLTSLKALTASKADFQSSVEEVAQQAAVIAAIGRVLANETMEGGDDESYRALAGEMRGGAAGLLEALKLNDFESAGNAVNRIEQSCNKCHEDWR
ncbi:MAG: hypothetical protein ACK557_20155 [Planctomycetota bacterium]